MPTYRSLNRNLITDRTSYEPTELKICMVLARAVTAQDFYKSYALQEIQSLLDCGFAGKAKYPIKRGYSSLQVFKQGENLVVQANITLTAKCRYSRGWIRLKDMLLPQTIIHGLKGRMATEIIDHPYLADFKVRTANRDEVDSWIQLNRRYLELAEFLLQTQPPTPPPSPQLSKNLSMPPSLYQQPSSLGTAEMEKLARLQKLRRSKVAGLSGVEWRLEAAKLSERQKERLSVRYQNFAAEIAKLDEQISQILIDKHD